MDPQPNSAQAQLKPQQAAQPMSAGERPGPTFSEIARQTKQDINNRSKKFREIANTITSDIKPVNGWDDTFGTQYDELIQSMDRLNEYPIDALQTVQPKLEKMASGKCYHHQTQDAVAHCVDCGKWICRDCVTVCGVLSGEYAGKSLCYCCTTKLVETNVLKIERFKSQVKKQLVFMAIGAIIGGILGAMSGYPSNIFVFALLGGSGMMVLQGFWAAIKMGSNLASGSYVGFVAGVIGICKLIIAPAVTIFNIIRWWHQITQANEIIASDAQALVEMRDYFNYTQVMEKKVANVSLAILSGQGGELFNNTYARAVIDSGEKIAQSELRKRVIQIAVNGETLKNFDTVNDLLQKIKKTASQN